jgi:hypothetical protein
MSTLAMLGNLAWAPVPAIESVEVLDRFNGVPTFGLFSTGGERQVFTTSELEMRVSCRASLTGTAGRSRDEPQPGSSRFPKRSRSALAWCR